MKVGIIGLGHGQRVLFEAFKLSNIKILGVASKDQKKAEIFSKKNNIIKKYKNWKEIIKDDEIDIIAIAVPAVHQIKIIRECIRYNHRFNSCSYYIYARRTEKSLEDG